MTKHVKIDNKEYHVCEVCELKYINKKMAEKCEEWCKEHKSCNLEIIKHSTE